MRVATFATSDRLLAATMRIRAEEAKATLQQASGQISDDYGGLGSTSAAVVSLQSSVTRSKAYSEAASTASARVEAMYDAVGSMLTKLTNFKATLSTLTTSSADSDTIALTAQSALEEVVALMNTQLSGRYLFSGSAVDTPAVDIDAITTPTSTSSADTSYYQGNGDVLSVKVSSEQTVSYGVTADDAGFETALRALKLIASGSTDSTSVTTAISLVADAIDGLSSVQTKLSLNASTFESAQSEQETYQSDTADLISSLSEVDVATVAAKMSTYEAQLQAAYAAIGKIADLSLASYLN
jgi:flagellar hook-associated protein 3 FlgL